MNFFLYETKLYTAQLSALPTVKLLITTLNAHSYNVAQHDSGFADALLKSEVLIPDGVSVVLAKRWLTPKPLKGELRNRKLQKIAGEDLFLYEMKQLDSRTKNQEPRQANIKKGKAFFLGSSEAVLAKIKVRAAVEFPHVEVHTYSPTYKPEFSVIENAAMIEAVNVVKPDVLFVGMTAPKQEKWAYQNFGKLQAGHVCCIGAVFDFYAGTVSRAPQWMIGVGLEWLYRLVKEPRRMWRRYLIGNVKFVGYMVIEKLFSKN